MILPLEIRVSPSLAHWSQSSPGILQPPVGLSSQQPGPRRVSPLHRQAPPGTGLPVSRGKKAGLRRGRHAASSLSTPADAPCFRARSGHPPRDAPGPPWKESSQPLCLAPRICGARLRETGPSPGPPAEQGPRAHECHYPKGSASRTWLSPCPPAVTPG